MRPGHFIKVATGAQWGSPQELLTSWLLASGAVSALTAVGDYVLSGKFQPLHALSILGLSLLGGMLLGALVAGVALLLLRLPLLWRSLSWAAVGLALASSLALSLDAFANLGGHYHRMALGVIGGSLVLGSGLSLTSVLLQPDANWQPAPLLRHEGRLWRTVFGIALGLGAAGCIYLDRTQYPGNYGSAHLALRLCALWCLAVLVLLTRLGIAVPHVASRRWLLGAGLTVLALPWFVLHSADSVALQTISERPMAAFHLAMARTLSDFDRDGYSSFLGGGDCAAWNSEVSPGGREIPDNGIDDNCILGDATGIHALREEVPVAQQPAPNSLILITIDTLRPDRMSVYGHTRSTTPHIKEWAESATRFTTAYTSGGWTSIAIPSLMKGLYPRHLQWNGMVETSAWRYLRTPVEGKLRENETIRARFLLPVEDPRHSMAELLQRRGMYTAAIVDGGFTGILAPEWGLGKGFDEFREIRKLPARDRHDASTVRQAWQVMSQRPKDKPYFMWLHFFGPHAPSVKRRSVQKFGTSVADRYDHEVAFVDQQVGWFLKMVNSQPGPNPAVVITSDHGERFYNSRVRGHGTDVSRHSVHIPLLVKAPGFPAANVSEPVSLVDIMPTVLALTETPAPRQLDGVDLAQLARGKAPGKRTLFVESFALDKTGTSFKRDLIAAVSGKHKLVRDRIRGTLSLHAEEDPAHPARNLMPKIQNPALVAALQMYLETAGGPPTVLKEKTE